MEGKNMAHGMGVKKDDIDINGLELLKKDILSRPTTVKETIITLSLDLGENVSAINVLQYLFPTREEMWQDKELTDAVQNALGEMKNKVAAVKDVKTSSGMTREEEKAEIKRIEDIERMRDAFRHEKELGGNKDR